jgi:hypothetical protein
LGELDDLEEDPNPPLTSMDGPDVTTKQHNAIVRLLKAIGVDKISQGAISSLVSDLASKAAAMHTHLKADITDFAHTHIIGDTTGLQAALDGKSSLESKDNGFKLMELVDCSSAWYGEGYHEGAYAAHKSSKFLACAQK